ncbi:MAG: ribosomal protein S18-alanine N-acetyltransferase [Paracoccaceae bacterium]
MTPAEMAALHARSFTTPRPWSEAEIDALLASPLVFALTRPGAFLLGRVVAGEAELLTIAVHPDQRRAGLGGALVDAFVTEARARGGESAFLEVAASNTAARALYANCGFAPAGRRRGYYHRPDGTSEDALVLVRSLM